MKIWLSKNSEISVREQLVAQIKIGIASGDLTVGERLPSTSEISRRFKIHANTVSSAYQILVEQSWLEFKKGSGYFVREVEFENSLDKIIAQFFQTAQNQGFTIKEIKQKVASFLEKNGSNQLIVIEDDADLREIIIEEIRTHTDKNVLGANFDEFQKSSFQNTVFAAMFDEKSKISLSENDFIFLKFRSAAASMTGETRPGANEIVAVVSGWNDFLHLAKTMLVAAEIEPESLLLRSTREKNWRKGLDAASIIICDSLTAKKLDGSKNIRTFRLISEDSLSELSRILQGNFVFANRSF